MSSLQQETKPRAQKSLRATVTGVDSKGQLFRDNAASVIILKNTSCSYLSPSKPVVDSVVMIEINDGKENWRSNAKVKSSAPGPDQTLFRITVELERSHPLLIDNPELATAPASVEAPPSDDRNLRDGSPLSSGPSGSQAPPEAAVPKPAVSVQPAATAPRPVRSVVSPPTAPSAESIAQVVRSVVTAQSEQLRRELQGELQRELQEFQREIQREIQRELERELQRAVARQVEPALQGPLNALERIQEQLRSKPSLTEDSVREIAEQAARNVQLEWVTTKMEEVISDAVRAALVADNDRRRREVSYLVSDQIEAALSGPLMTKVQKIIDTQLDQKIEKKLATRPSQNTDLSAPFADKVVSEIENRLNAFSAELNRMLADRK